MKSKQKAPRMRTPVGVAMFPRLDKPDLKFATADKPFGHFKTSLALELKDPATKKFLAELEALKAAAIEAEEQELGKKIKKIADSPWKAEEDEDGNPTGRVIVNFKAPGGGRRDDGSEWVGEVNLFDSKNKPLDQKSTRVGGGSEIVVSFEPRGFYVPAMGAGISLRLRAVQIRKLVTWGASDAASYGFESTDDGYVAEEPSVPAGNAVPVAELDNDEAI